jgi:hypothetical protein
LIASGIAPDFLIAQLQLGGVPVKHAPVVLATYVVDAV